MVGHPAVLAGVTTASSAPMTGFPRAVLVETFTGVWCIHCPAESQALHYIDDSTNRSVIAISELHVCAFAPGTGPCLDNYVPPDNTTITRGAWYNVCGYPDVFFDGQHDMCGATDNTSQMQGIYDRAIANASAYPGNVSISQSADYASGVVTDHISVIPVMNGTYNAITYLLEYIDKQNQTTGYGPHDVDWVVRATLRNHPIALVAGQPTEFTTSGNLLSTWNPHNLSVVTFVQENSTKIVENAQFDRVATLTASISSTQGTVISGTQSTITVQVANSTSGAPLAGATVNLSVSAGGTLVPANGVTASNGSFTATFTAPSVSTSEADVIAAQVSAANYTGETSTTSVVVTPVVLPLAPSGLTIGPGDGNVSLAWTPPSSGGTGLIYHVFRSSSPTGTFSEVGTSATTSYVDNFVTGGQSYWYEVSAANAFGFSPNTTAAPATAVTAVAQGIPVNVGWWLSIDSMNCTSPTNYSLYLFLPSGFFAYSFGAASYAYIPGGGGTTTVHSTGASLSLTIPFTPRWATLEGTVTPGDATVTVNGAAVTVSAGSFSELLAAGTYSLTVRAPGYQENDTNVVLTPGNLTPVTIDLQPVQSGSSSSSSGFGGGMTTDDAVIVLVGVVAVVAIAAAGAVIVSRRRGARRAPARPRARPPEDPPEEEA